MNTTATSMSRSAAFELRFQFLFKEGRALAFPCDEQGRVDIDRLPERARENYFCARTLIGREFAAPSLRAVVQH